MLAKLGFAALVILVGSEAFVGAASILWPLAAIAHLGKTVETGTLVISALAGVAGGALMGIHALRIEKALLAEAAEASQTA